jgi:hypothetical protein
VRIQFFRVDERRVKSEAKIKQEIQNGFSQKPMFWKNLDNKEKMIKYAWGGGGGGGVV